MTKQTATVDISSFSTDAKFRTWGLAASTAINACGLVQTSDTGQINWSTVLKPTVINTKAGYEIYRFADTLQSTKPVFIKIEYGIGGAGTTSPSVWATVGTGSNGSGTITGATVGPTQGFQYSQGTDQTALLMQFTHSTANGYALLNFGSKPYGGAGTVGVFIVERTKDSSGVSTGDGVGLTTIYWTAGATLTIVDQSINFNTSTAYATLRPPFCGALDVVRTLSTGPTQQYYLHYINPGQMYNSVGRLSVFLGDLTNLSVVSVTPIGSTAHSYYYSTVNTGGDTSANGNIVMMYMWED